jgi:hypothetical protein
MYGFSWRLEYQSTVPNCELRFTLRLSPLIYHTQVQKGVMKARS